MLSCVINNYVKMNKHEVVCEMVNDMSNLEPILLTLNNFRPSMDK